MIKRTTSGVLGFGMLIAILTTVPVLGEIIDRMIVIIDDTSIITLSDVRRERAIRTALGARPGDDDSLIESLIEKHLVEGQIALFREIEVDENAVEERLRNVEVPPNVLPQELRDAVVADLRRREFTIQRFRPFVQVSDEELRTYFEQVLVPALRQSGEPIPPVEQGMLLVRPAIIAEKIEKEVGEWLADLRRRSKIEKILK